MTLVLALLAAAALFPALDAFARLLRALRFRGPSPERREALTRLLVLVPSRAEGLRMLPLCRDLLREPAMSVPVTVCVILDGGDAEAERALAAERVEVFVKTPAGPSKGAALAFAIARLGTRLDTFDSILVFDADMRVPVGFLRALAVPPRTDAFQLPVRPAGIPTWGAARVEALSLAVATRVEDLARDASGLPVRLRGKAMGFSPNAFRIAFADESATLAEDSEATLRLLARGIRVRALARPMAFDEPATLGNAMAAPRARWLAGHAKLLVLRARDLVRLAGRAPGATLAIGADLFLRPRAFVLSTLGLAALGSGALLLTPVLEREPLEPMEVAASALLAIAVGTLICEVLYYKVARRILGTPPELPRVKPRDLLAYASLWMKASRRAVAAPGRWHRARPPA